MPLRLMESHSWISCWKESQIQNVGKKRALGLLIIKCVLQPSTFRYSGGSLKIANDKNKNKKTDLQPAVRTPEEKKNLKMQADSEVHGPSPQIS